MLDWEIAATPGHLPSRDLAPKQHCPSSNYFAWYTYWKYHWKKLPIIRRLDVMWQTLVRGSEWMGGLLWTCKKRTLVLCPQKLLPLLVALLVLLPDVRGLGGDGPTCTTRQHLKYQWWSEEYSSELVSAKNPLWLQVIDLSASDLYGNTIGFFHRVIEILYSEHTKGYDCYWHSTPPVCPSQS